MADLQNAVVDGVKNRFSGAVLGTFSTSLLVLNWQSLTYLFSNIDPDKKIEAAKVILKIEFGWTLFHAFWITLIICILSVLSTAVYESFKSRIEHRIMLSNLRDKRKLLDRECGIQELVLGVERLMKSYNNRTRSTNGIQSHINNSPGLAQYTRASLLDPVIANQEFSQQVYELLLGFKEKDRYYLKVTTSIGDLRAEIRKLDEAT